MMVLKILCVITLVASLFLFIIGYLLRRARKKNTIGIFHLYCSSGGGGERVLWHAIKDDPLQILLKAKKLFKIDLMSDSNTIERLEFIPLSLAFLVEDKNYPFLTLFLQNFMSAFVALQAACNLVPEVYMETIGFTFTLPVFKLLGSIVITYVHYPTISEDMIENVLTSSHASFNNRAIFVKSSLLRKLKLVYYKLLAYMYGIAGRRADLVMVNSSWTQNHIKSLWQTEAHVVHPPCDVDSFKSLPLERFDDRPKNRLNIISIAQFRPEKNHQLQIEAFDSFLNKTRIYESHLTLYGGCRDHEDERRVAYLRDLIGRLDLGSRVSIVVNAPFQDILKGAREADVAIHTMANEHFGIVLLEFMAAGLITVAHNSGGPRVDIIDDKTNGFLATDIDEFASILETISLMNPKDRHEMRLEAIKKSERFSVQVFESKIIKLVDKFFSSPNRSS